VRVRGELWETGRRAVPDHEGNSEHIRGYKKKKKRKETQSRVPFSSTNRTGSIRERGS